jgi:hypothetical protein
MAIQIITHAEEIGVNPVSVGDYVLYDRSPDGDPALPWLASLVDNPDAPEGKLLGCFSSKANALTFVLAHEASGWDDGGVLREAAIAVLRNEPPPRHEHNVRRLGFAIASIDSQRPRALVVVENGLATVHATPSVDAVVVNLDNCTEFAPHELLPVHVSFAELLDRAGINWPTAMNGRHQEVSISNHARSHRAHIHLVK